jgi:hypothetical protein
MGSGMRHHQPLPSRDRSRTGHARKLRNPAGRRGRRSTAPHRSADDRASGQRIIPNRPHDDQLRSSLERIIYSRVISAVVRPRHHDLDRDGLAELDAIGLRLVVGHGCEIARSASVSAAFMSQAVFWSSVANAAAAPVAAVVRCGRVGRQLQQIRLVSPLDRTDRVEHRDVDHPYQALSRIRRHRHGEGRGRFFPIGDHIGARRWRGGK